jgi:glutathione synthase
MLPLKVVIVQPAIVLLAFFNGEPVTELNGYAGYLVRSKTAKENEDGIHSGKGVLDSITLVDE